MARARSIKPDFWNHPLVIECSPEARLLFLGLWTHCDDGGRHPATPKAIKGKVFPADTFSAEQVEVMLRELVTNGLLKAYGANGMTFLEVIDWSSWQSVKNPTFQWPDETGAIPGRKRARTATAQAPAPQAPNVPTPETKPDVAPPPAAKTPPNPRSTRKAPPAEGDLIDQHAEQISAYQDGKWRLEWGNPPGLGCSLPEAVQAHMLKDGEKELVIE
jgi:hypothetical protein